MALPILDGNQTAATLSTIITGGAHIPAHTVVSLGSQAISDITSGVSGSVVSISNFPASQAVTFAQASVTFGATTGSVSVLNLPSTQTVAGTVTANMLGRNANYTSGITALQLPIIGFDETIETADAGLVVPVQITNTLGVVGGSNALPISGTVTANVNFAGDESFTVSPGKAVQLGYFDSDAVNFLFVSNQNGLPIQPVGSLPIGSLPSGAIAPRFGSVATANLAFITSAVTNTSRKYLLAQNISAGTVTIGIGFSPTTTQGIQLPAGGGLTFDAFCPIGAVYWLGAVTGAAFTILEG